MYNHRRRSILSVCVYQKVFLIPYQTSSNEVIDVTQRNNPKANCTSEDKHSHTLYQPITFFVVNSL